MKTLTHPALCLAALLSIGAATAGAASISVTDPDMNNAFTFNYFIGTQTAADNLVATSGPDARAFSNDGVEGFRNATGLIHPEAADGDPRTIVFHFDPAPGLIITGATVYSASFIIDGNNASATDDDFIKGYWSTDNVSYKDGPLVDDPFLEVLGDGPNSNTSTIDLASDGFTGGADLYLKYVLQRDADNVLRHQLFRSTDDDNGFIVNLTLAQAPIAAIPEPSTLMLLVLGAIGLAWAARRRR